MTDETLADPQSPAPTPTEFLEAWMDFAQKLGMRMDPAAGPPGKSEDLFAGLAPALGMSRDYQEVGRQMLELSVRFQRQCMVLRQQGADVGQRALHAFQQRTAGKAAPIGAAALYDAWIDEAEAAYAGTAHSEPFARLLGDLCNTLSAFKVQRGKLLEALARSMDWPSRAEVDSLHRRVMAIEAAQRSVTESAKISAAPVRKAPVRQAPVRTAQGSPSPTPAKRAKRAKPAKPAKRAKRGKRGGR